jgi:hypothetical protein
MEINNLSVKGRIAGLVVLAVAVILVIVGLSGFNFLRIKKVDKLKDRVHEISKSLMYAQLAEKAYTQFFEDQLKTEFLR